MFFRLGYFLSRRSGLGIFFRSPHPAVFFSGAADGWWDEGPSFLPIEKELGELLITLGKLKAQAAG